ncbi:DWNN-domain-containing protein [Phellopilus nigrolimitatus]|nr:DWNN-domain-containing protein [Phellopilus nigrolimitatus]
MTSSVYYKFKSQRDESKVSFDGTGISVFDLKKEIVLANNLKANDFDLLLYNSSTDQEYKDDSYIIPRSSLVIAKRIPAAKAGKGKGSMYLTATTSTAASSVDSSAGKERQAPAAFLRARIGVGAMSKRFDGKEESPKPRSSTPTAAASVSNNASNSDEAAAMAAMFKAQTNVWEETQEKMSQAVPIYSNSRGTGRGGKQFVTRQTHHQPDRPLPPSYVCYRCGQKGHWIHDCPTNNDRDYDNRPRIKRTTGIPRSFLKAVESPSEGKLGQGVMVTPDGGYVVAQPDVVSWQKQVTRPKGLTPSDVRERPPADPALACPIDNRLFLDAVKTPCCGTLYCEDCIHSHLLENDFICPKCSKKVSSLDNLVIDKPMRTRVGDYIDKVIRESLEAEEAAFNAAENSQQDLKDESALKSDGEVQFDQQPGSNFDLSQLLNETIPQLQAQIAQLSVMLQNPSLPMQVRQSTVIQFQQYQMQLQQAQAFASLAADMTAVATAAQHDPGNMSQNFVQNQWSTPFPNQQPAGLDSAYQRLPVSSRRRTNKRDRPSDFLEIGGSESQVKMPRYWE